MSYWTLLKRCIVEAKERGAWIVVLLPVLYMFVYILYFGVNVPFRDGWAIPFLLDQLFTDQLFLDDVFAQHNEHRPLFPRMIILLVSLVVEYNNIALVYVSYVLLALVSYLLWIRFDSDMPIEDRTLKLWLFSPMVWLVFSPRKHANLLMGYDIQMFLMIFCAVLTIYLLSTHDDVDRYLLFAILAAFVSGFSRIEGLAVWPIGLILIGLSGNERAKRAAIWVGSSAFALAMYFHDWSQPASSPSLSTPLFNPLDTMGYFFVVLGSPIMFYEEGFSVAGYTPNSSLVLLFILLIGVFTSLSVLLFMYTTYNRGLSQLSNHTFWIGLALFAVAISGMLTIGRSGFGIAQATSSRYTAITVFLYVAVYYMIAILVFEEKINSERIDTAIRYAVIGFLFVGIMVGYVGGTIAGVNRSANLNDACNAVLDYEHSSDESLSILTTPNGSIDRIRDGAAILDKYDLGPFHPRQSCRWNPLTRLLPISAVQRP